MSSAEGVSKGMQVYGADEHLLGVVDNVQDGGMLVGGRPIPYTAVRRIEEDRIYLTDAGATYNPQGAERGDSVNVEPNAGARGGSGADVRLTTTPKE